MVKDGSIAMRGIPEPKTEAPGRMDAPLSTVDAAQKFLEGRELAAHADVPEAFGTRNAVYDLLEQMGVRWFIPGDIGTVIPDKATIQVEEQTKVEAPSFPSRYYQGVARVWEARMRSGGMHFPSSHGIVGFSLGDKELFKEHPEYYALVDGKRVRRQLCISNPDVLQRAIAATKKFFREHPSEDIIGMGPIDGRGFCECENCKALDGGDYDPFGNYASMTDRYVWFFNQVLEGIKDEFPDKRIGFYAYSVYNRPPVKMEAESTYRAGGCVDYYMPIHGMGNPVCLKEKLSERIVRRLGQARAGSV